MTGIERHWWEVEQEERKARRARYDALKCAPTVQEYLALKAEFDGIQQYPQELMGLQQNMGMTGVLAGLIGGLGAEAADYRAVWP